MDLYKKIAQEYVAYWPLGYKSLTDGQSVTDYRFLKIATKYDPDRFWDYSGMYAEFKDYMYEAPKNIYNWILATFSAVWLWICSYIPFMQGGPSVPLKGRKEDQESESDESEPE